MVKIVYGIQSDGLGHYGRSKAVIDFLESKGHIVKVLTSDKAYQFMKDKYDVEHIERIFFTYTNNRVDYVRTLLNISIKLGKIIRNGYFKTRKIIRNFKPDVIISDFEIFTSRVAYELGIPLISIDNIHSLTHTRAGNIVNDKFLRFELEQKVGVMVLVPFANHFFITSFFDAEVMDKKKTTIVPSLIRKEIVDMKKIMSKEISKDYILVYQTSDTNKKLVPELNKVKGQEFIVYGFNTDKKIKNCTLKKHSSEGFLNDLKYAKAIISNGGFTLISEAVFLGKPVLSNPVECQYEQILNASHIERLGYGKFIEKIDAKSVKTFISNIDKYVKNLSKNSQKDNSIAFRAIENKVKELSKRKKKKLFFLKK